MTPSHTPYIDHGWRTCQTYAQQAAQSTTLERAVEFAERAERIAANETDQYRRTAVLMWPIAALRSRGLDELADAMFDRVFPGYELIEPYSSRADALDLLLKSGPYDCDRADRICTLMLATANAESPPFWRVAWSTKYFVRQIGALASDTALRFVRDLNDNRLRAECERIIEKQDFFWSPRFQPNPFENPPPNSQ